MKNYILLIGIFFSLSATACRIYVGPNTLEGTVSSKANSELLPFVNVVLFQNGNMIRGTQSDFDGRYQISNLRSGKYELRMSYFGYETSTISDITIEDSTTKFVDIKLVENSPIRCGVVISCCCYYIVPAPIEQPVDLFEEQEADSIDWIGDFEKPSEEVKVSVFPNPATSWIVFKELNTIESLTIYNLNGKYIDSYALENRSELRLELTKYQPGTYLAVYTIDGIPKTTTFIKR